ncbi:short-chain dehydrogenase/reductase family 16C member 6-like [Bolinopsis microptera]|uniref:short-chain dehydrogenase/reductase family 16C member 6-like n=1 Tax=Bolinopsis microptera TaxID=2820187 RepID=UPI0030792584
MFIFEFLLEFLEFLWLYTWTVFWEFVYLISRNRPKKEIKNAHILITGAGQGIGKMLASNLANSGNTLHLVDINSETNEENIKDFAAKDCTVYTYSCDVSKLDSIIEMNEKVMGNCPKIDYLFNNAGIIIGKLFPETSIKEMDLTMNVNIMGVMHITKIFLDGIIENGGHLIFTGSVAGQIGAPFMTDYCTAKHAVTGFSRTLLYDLEHMGIKHVKITTVFPHFTDTGLVRGATVKLPLLFPLLDPVWVADQIVAATREERNEVILPRATNYVILLMYLMPCEVFRRFCKWLGNDLMKTFRQTRSHEIN